MRQQRLRTTGQDGQEGMALVMVLAGSAAALAMVFAMIMLTTGSIGAARHSEATVAAEAAAEAGIDDFLYRLNRNSDYWRYAWVDPASGSRQPLPEGEINDALDAPGKVVPGGGTDERYTYTVTDPPTGANGGRLTLKIVGTSRRSTHTYKTTIGRNGFLDYMYFTDYETSDPDRYPSTGSAAQLSRSEAVTSCQQYKWRQVQQGATRDTRCQEIVFGSNDQINGPLHTNDTLKTSSSAAGWPRFIGPVSTENPIAPYFDRNGSMPTFAEGIQARGHIGMPSSNSSLRAEADTNGCVFTGPTRIWLTANGKMRVLSPLTKATRPGCTPTTSSDMALPPDGVIYVQGVPSSTSDPNYGTDCNRGNFYPNLNAGAPSGPNLMPAGDVTQYGCRDGDVFIQGSLRGQLTVGAGNRIIVTDDLIYASAVAPSYSSVPPTSTDVLGLIPNNSVEIYHPVSAAGNNLTGTNNDVKLNAAMLALQHSVTVQNYNTGAQLGNFTILGAMAQKFRGPVGTSGGGGRTGYSKDYTYDSRFKAISPPYFIDPLNAPWSVKNFAEIPNGS